MQILAIDQSLHSSGWVIADGDDNRLVAAGLFTTPSTLTDIDAIIHQRGQLEVFLLNSPMFAYVGLVLFEDIHYTRSFETFKKLAGLLYVMRGYCIDHNRLAHEVIPSHEIMKHLHLTAFKTGRVKKAERARAYAQTVVWGSVHKAPPNQPQEDIASAIVILGTYLARTGQVLGCTDPAIVLR